MTDVKVVAPTNMGTRLVWDEVSKKYNVDVDDLVKRIDTLDSVPEVGDFVYQKIGDFEIRKFPDGTMIQTNVVNFKNGYKHDTVYSFNWAVSFAAAPMVFGSVKAVESGGSKFIDKFQMDLKTKSNGSTYYYYLYDPGGEQGDWDMQFLAIGRWKE